MTAVPFEPQAKSYRLSPLDWNYNIQPFHSFSFGEERYGSHIKTICDHRQRQTTRRRHNAVLSAVIECLAHHHKRITDIQRYYQGI